MQDETVRKGPWIEEEDERLTIIVTLLGERGWDSIAKSSGLGRSGKSCRLRWMNYLRPNLKHGRMSAEEESIILQLHERWGNKWSRIAQKLPGRTDNEVKNYWRTHFRKKAQAQEKENLQRVIDATSTSCATQDLLVQESDWRAQTTSFEPSESSVKDGIWGNLEDSIDFSALSYHAFASSPYETHQSDWIAGLSNDPSAVKHNGECNILDSWFSYPTWISGNGESIWDCSDSFWDMEQINSFK